MPTIVIDMVNGKQLSFAPKGRAGGSYTNSIRYEADFAIVTDEWGVQTAIPSRDIERVTVEPERRW